MYIIASLIHFHIYSLTAHMFLYNCNECQICVIFKFLKVVTAPQLAIHKSVAIVTSLPQTQHVARVCCNKKVP